MTPQSRENLQRRAVAEFAARPASKAREQPNAPPGPLEPLVNEPADSPEAATRVPQWPEPLAPEAFHGLAGEVMRAIEPHTEADASALLVQFLVAFGNCVGSAPYFRVEATEHRANLFTVLIGNTSKARKGTSWDHIRRLFHGVDEEWTRHRILSGLSSGEGLTFSVRDPISEIEKPRRASGKLAAHSPRGGNMVVVDPGVGDKRLLVVEPEFGRVLTVSERQANTLSATLRQAWDNGDLNVLTKSNRVTATGAHISVIGHVTAAELRRLLTDTQCANGYANRFLWTCARRSKFLPEGGCPEENVIEALARRAKEAIRFARTAGELRRDDDARSIWKQVYADLSEGRPGLLGAVTLRSEAQATRLSLVYALLDGSASITGEHLLAALAVWRYCEASARFVFGEALGDPAADEILNLLKRSPGGVSRSEISQAFGRNKPASDIQRALGVLAAAGLAVSERRESGGRPVEKWFAALTKYTK